MSNLSNALKAAALTAVLGAGVTLAPKADAVLLLNTTMGAACKAASGPGASVFYFSNLYAENVSPNLQYLTCYVPDMADSATTGDVPALVEWSMRNAGTVAADSTCVIQNGFLYTGFTVSSAVITKTAVAAGADTIFAAGPTTTPALPARSSGAFFSPYSLSCAAPAASRFSLLHTNVNGTKV